MVVGVQAEVAVGGGEMGGSGQERPGLRVCLVSGEEMEGEVRMSAGTPAGPAQWVILSLWRQGMGEEEWGR